MKTRKESLKSELKQLFGTMDFVSKHTDLDGEGKEAERMAEVYQQLGKLWEFLALQCAHTDGWRKAEEGKKVCKLCGTVQGAEERWHLPPRKGSKAIGRRVTPKSKETFPSKKAATIVEDSIRFWDHYRGLPAREIIEREDGWIGTSSGPGCYFAEYPDWDEHEREAMKHVRGRVIDVGCGAGRNALYLREKGFDVLGVDLSPLAIHVSMRREMEPRAAVERWRLIKT